MYKVNKKDEVPIYLFHQGTNYKAYEFLGSHSSKRKGVSGAVFRVWAPRALSVSVVGDFNNWDRANDPMEKISENGLWEVFIPQIKQYDMYKYSIETSTGDILLKTDPMLIICRPDRNRHPAFMSWASMLGRTRRGWKNVSCKIM